jgi:RNA polymerase sporulation-specific sigma factor
MQTVPEEEWIVSIQNGQLEYMDELLVRYKSLVRTKAKAMYLIGGETEDLIQEGMIGLIKAIRDYDATRSASFRSFAELCISRQMYTAIETSRRQKHMPLNSYVSLYEADDSKEDGKHVPLIDTIEGATESNPETLYLGKEFTEGFVEELNHNLSSMEKDVLYFHSMGKDYREIAQIFGKCPKSIDNALQRIRQKAMRLLHA